MSQLVVVRVFRCQTRARASPSQHSEEGGQNCQRTRDQVTFFGVGLCACRAGRPFKDEPPSYTAAACSRCSGSARSVVVTPVPLSRQRSRAAQVATSR
jgi:hypothetical protein